MSSSEALVGNSMDLGASRGTYDEDDSSHERPHSSAEHPQKEERGIDC